jgi:hypothetical protein
LLSRKESVDDLGILFDKGLSFVDHINSITSTAFKNLGYIYRNCKSFRDIACWKLLFFAFVRSKLEYGSLIWYPIYKVHINRVESVQRRFLKFLIFLEEGNYPIQGIDQAVLLQRFNMYSLGVRRIVASVKFLHDLLHNCLDCPPLLDYINFYVPRISSRSFVPFYCDKARTNIYIKSSIYLMCKNANDYCADCDLFVTNSFHMISGHLYCLLPYLFD